MVSATPTQRLTAEAWRRLILTAQVLAEDEHGPKVFLLSDGLILKLFRAKGLLGWKSALQEIRFVRAARAVQHRGIASVCVTRRYRLSRRQRAVAYPFIEGRSVRELVHDNQASVLDRSQLIEQLADFCARLHHAGIYFRGLHLGNVLRTAAGPLALIDVSDTRFFARPLSLRRRVRNFRPLLRYSHDVSALGSAGLAAFFDRYCTSARLTPATAAWLNRTVHQRYLRNPNSPTPRRLLTPPL